MCIRDSVNVGGSKTMSRVYFYFLPSERPYVRLTAIVLRGDHERLNAITCIVTDMNVFVTIESHLSRIRQRICCECVSSRTSDDAAISTRSVSDDAMLAMIVDETISIVIHC